MIWLAGMFILLPVEMLKLPFNTTLVDIWTVLGLPLVGLSVARGQHIISVYYAIPIWLILVSSFASTFVAPDAGNALIVVIKELFVIVWFVTATIAMVRLDARDFRRILVIWSVAVILHGLVIIGQFLSPEIWRFTAEHLGRGAQYEIYRPSGLMTNANGAAFFQLLGFVPFLLMRPSRRVGSILGLILLGMMLSTGSMAAVLAFTSGLAVSILTLAARGHLSAIAKTLVRLTVASSVLAAIAVPVIGQNQRYQNHLQEILLGRAERSSDSRFDLWERGVNVFVDENVFLWGIGPENFRVVDGRDNQLHNDFLAFAVERGLIGTLGLGLFALLATLRAVELFLISNRQYPDGTRLVVIVLLGAMVAAFVYSLTHQVFHNRQLWIILAVQEAMYFRLMNSGTGRESPSTAEKAPPGAGARLRLESRST